MSPLAGTTRDVVEVTLTLGGYVVILSDTAGLRETPADEVEQEGIRRARERIESADVRVCVVDSSSEASWADVLSSVDENTILVVNKCDLAKKPVGLGALGERRPARTIYISCITGEGVSELEDLLQQHVKEQCASLFLLWFRHLIALKA